MPGNFGSDNSQDGAVASTTGSNRNGIFGRNDGTAPAEEPGGNGVFGVTLVPGGSGVFGANNSPTRGRGVQGNGPEAGVGGFSENGSGVLAQSHNGPGLSAQSGSGPAILAQSPNGDGLSSQIGSNNRNAIFASNTSSVDAVFPGGNAVFGVTTAPGGNGVFGSNNSPTKGRGVQGNGPEVGVGAFSENGVGVLAESKNIGLMAQGGKLAARFVGDIEVTGDIKLTNADCAEEFDVVDSSVADPGTVMIMADAETLRPATRAYDTRVAGIVSGAGLYRPALMLDHRSCRPGPRCAIALIGKVYCKVDADQGPIRIGDLLTSSSTLGYAMKASDPTKAFGAIIGKALESLSAGRGLISVLVSLQ
jgi:hypothetical protein